MTRARLDGLDGLRGIAAGAVLLLHVFHSAGSNAYLAVDFFFVLSGYVMARSYGSELADGGVPAARTFLAARVRRLYPTVVLASLVGWPWLHAMAGDGAPWLAVATLLLLPVDGPLGPYMLNPPIWSVAFELVANVVHAAVLARIGVRPLVALGVVLGVALLLLTGGCLDVVPGAGSRVVVLVRTLAPYVVGMVLYRLWRDQPPIRIGPLVTWATMPAVFAFGSLVPASRGLLDLPFVLLACPLLIAGGLRNGSGSRLARGAGALSFPLYAIHAPVVLTLKACGVSAGWQIVAGLVAGVAFWGLLRGLGRSGGFRLRVGRLSPVA